MKLKIVETKTQVNIDVGGIAVALTIAFVVLKLIGRISWSWWWVFSPLWLGVIILGLALAAAAYWEDRNG